ncbi:MAG: hypothetical protein IJM43_08205 [Bacteroidaceae bacterium]|nr:hypothetical protein [Bacteroidaceae bacterium]
MIKQYYKIIEGETVFFKEPLIVNGMQIYNPSEELLFAAGWQVYTPPPTPTPEPADETKYEPYTEEVVDKLKKLLQEQVKQQTDEEALSNIELFPTWQSKLGIQVQQGERLYYDDKLYKVLQSHTPQDDWRPDKTASLYVQVVADDSGTIDNPVAYEVGMELVEGKYYTEDSVKYRCTRSLAQSVWHLADLVGNYVEVV